MANFPSSPSMKEFLEERRSKDVPARNLIVFKMSKRKTRLKSYRPTSVCSTRVGWIAFTPGMKTVSDRFSSALPCPQGGQFHPFARRINFEQSTHSLSKTSSVLFLFIYFFFIRRVVKILSTNRNSSSVLSHREWIEKKESEHIKRIK